MPSLFLLALPVLGLALFLYAPLQDQLQAFFPSVSPQIRLSQGLVLGTIVNDGFPKPVEAFMGLPYSMPPTEDRRFRPAVPLPASNRTFVAKKYGSVCPGKQLLKVKVNPMSEDCMSVNIFREKGVEEGAKVPVAVYIHGGAFNRGSSMMHNTASMVGWSEKPFIGVSFNYRIGALGFLPSKLTFDEGIVNLGLHDQVFLLQWVQENIAAFGGDPSDVTIFGLSAGAHSIGHHILNYKEGVPALFHKAILESGAPTSRAVHPYNAPVHEDQFALFVEEAGCGKVSPSEITSCLRTQPAEMIIEAQATVFYKYNPSLRWAFQPVIDSELIHQRPIDAWNSGKWNKVPIMTGHTTNEGTYYVPPGLSTPEGFTDFWHTLLPHYTPEDLKTINSLYPDPSKNPKSVYTESRNMTALSIGPQFKRVEAAYAHYAYACPVRQTASIVSSASSKEPPVFLYHWALNQTVKGGANHGDNMWYETFDKAITSISPAQEEVSGLLHAYVTSFITSGNPNTVKGRFENRPDWKAYTKNKAELAMTFGQGNDERAGGSSTGTPAKLVDSKWVKKECAFWWEKSVDTEE
ncbi:carboxylic ester hydrolase-4 [Coleophoma cylindrospora]|uniref:Carboxylic ester hydrolase n=1 Tax=Coleophoma cylindrospora TaxID=1849047 RepID=A0A3D8SHH8_9HELO|nr:carboxylic ester hydrolase-4 [Coleophoma cylindrospora]